jgi:hypothetical protein
MDSALDLAMHVAMADCCVEQPEAGTGVAHRQVVEIEGIDNGFMALDTRNISAGARRLGRLLHVSGRLRENVGERG